MWGKLTFDVNSTNDRLYNINKITLKYAHVQIIHSVRRHLIYSLLFTDVKTKA